MPVDDLAEVFLGHADGFRQRANLDLAGSKVVFFQEDAWRRWAAFSFQSSQFSLLGVQ